MQPIHLILLGAPGAGKSTQSRLLHQKFPLVPFATGQMLRDEVARGSTLGVLADNYFQRGTLLPDEVMIAMMSQRLRKLRPQQGILLDGFPRTTAQAEALDRILTPLDRALTAVIALDLSDDEALHRLGGRRMCEGLGAPFALHVDDQESIAACIRLGGKLTQRDDDQPDVIRERLRVYEAETAPLLDFYGERGLLQRISAAGAAEAVHAAIVAALDTATGAASQA